MASTIKIGTFKGREVSTLNSEELEKFYAERTAYRKKKAHDYYVNKYKKPSKTERKNCYYFMKVTADALELPLSPPCQLRDVEKVLGVSRKSVHGMVVNAAREGVNHHKKEWKIIRFMAEGGEL